MRLVIALAIVSGACAPGVATRDEGRARSDLACPTAGSSAATGIDRPAGGTELHGSRSALVPNGDFSDGLKGWLLSDPETVALETGEDDNSRQLMRVAAGPTTKLRYINSSRFAVTPGAEYRLDVRGRVTMNEGDLASFFMVFSSTREVRRDGGRLDVRASGPGFTDYTLTGRVPFGATQALVQVQYGHQRGSVELAVRSVTYTETGQVWIEGWAVDGAPVGSSAASAVSLYLDGPPGIGSHIGDASVGLLRDDLLAACGDERFARAGWRYDWETTSLSPGPHSLYALLQSTGGATSQARTIVRRLPTFPLDPFGAIVEPVEGTSVGPTVRVAGWAVDRNSTTAAGISGVRIYLDGGPEAGVFLGHASHGEPYPGAARHFGAVRFGDAGWQFIWDTADVAAGDHTLFVVLDSHRAGVSTTLSRHLIVGAGRDVSRGKVAQASHVLRGSSSTMALDGLDATLWNSGNFPPQWIEIDLGSAMSVARVRLVPAQAPVVGFTRHRVLGRAPGSAATLLHEFAGVTSERQVLEYSPPLAWPGIRYIRIETVESPAWVAWREISIFRPEATPTTTVRGLVQSAGRAVAGARLELRVGEQVLGTVFSDDDGGYVFTSVPADVQYVVRAYRPLGEDTSWAQRALEATGRPVALEAGVLVLPDP